MAYTQDSKPQELTELTTLATDDTFIVGDTSDTQEVVKYITKSNLLADLQDETQTLTNKTIDADNNTISNLALGAEVSGASTDLTDTADLTYNADTDVSANGWVLDEDNMASDSATKVPTQQSVKAYVDNNASTPNTLDGAYDQGGSGSGRSITADSGAVAITVPDTSNNAGLTITQNDVTNDPLALEINGKGSGAKVTNSTLVQFNDTDGNNSDWSFNVAGDGFPVLNLQSTGGTLGTPTVSSETTKSTIDTYAYNSTPAQTLISSIKTSLLDQTASTEDSAVIVSTIAGGSFDKMLNIGSTYVGGVLNGIEAGNAAAAGVVSSAGSQDLVLQTGNATTGNITLTDGANGNITISPNGSGEARVGANRILTTADEGTGNGLDADTVDGVEASAFLQDIVDDTTPQLGGELDAQGNNIVDLADVTFQTGATGGTLRTGTSNADKFVLQAYDVDGAAYQTVLELNAGNDPILQLRADFLEIDDNTDETKRVTWDVSGATTSTTTDLAFAQSANRTITFPDATDTLVGRATTDTLTNKTIDADNNTISNIALGAEATGALGDLSNVTESTPANDEVLQYVTDHWENQTLSEAGIAPVASPSFTGTVTLPTGLTGVLRADSGVVSTDSDVTDIVSAATTSAAGKVELATDAESTALSATDKVLTPSNASAILADPGTIGGTDPATEVNYDVADGTVSALGNLGATEAIDWSTATHFTGTLDSNVTITHSNEVSGRKITLYLSYDGSAQRTITWSDVDKWLDGTDGSAPAAPSASGEVLVVTLQYIGTTCYAIASGNYAVY